MDHLITFFKIIFFIPDINYFHCLQIIDILKTTEADSKNLFGRYGSQRMKDWQEIVKIYEKDNIYIAEAAQIYVRNIQFEIPGIKKQISKFEQLGDEAEKKIVDLQKSENTVKNEYNLLCSQLGIKGDNVRAELVEKLKEMPEILTKIASSVQNLSKAVKLYTDFVGNSNILPVIRHILKSGNTTVYEFLYSEPPLSVEEPEIKIKIEEAENSKNDNEIDFGDGNAIDFGDGNEINFDVGEDGEVNLEVGDIDWGGIEGDGQALGEDIDFSISLEESGIVVEEAGTSGGVAKGDEAYTLLDSPAYRESFINELLELEAFLKMRLYELSTADKIQILSLTILNNFPDHDVKSLAEMLSYVDIAYASTTNNTLHHLHQIKHNPKYVDIITGKMMQKLVAIDKMKDTRVVLKDKAESLREQAIQLRPTLTRVIEQTKILQSQIEKDISKRYKNRIVNLMGGVNSM